MQTIDLDKTTIKNYLINRSFLVNKAKDIYEVLDQYKCIQVDPINVICRSHELALWNRVENFSLKDLNKGLYEDKKLFEYWLQLFSIIPAKFYPYLSARMDANEHWHEDFYSKHSKEIEEVYGFVKNHGVTSPKDIAHLNYAANLFSWSNSNSRTALLEYLWDIGKFMIHHREKNQRFYDLTENVLDKSFNYKASKEESIHFMISSYFDYAGLLRGTFAQRIGYARKLPIKEKILEMIESGEILNVKIDDVKTKYMIRKDQVGDIENSESQHDQINILPPLDPLVIDRKLLEDIFGFKYTWEAYVPQVKRKFGYYGLPILYKGNFVGQIELRKNKEKKIDILKLEVGLPKGENRVFMSMLKKEIKGLERFVFQE